MVPLIPRGLLAELDRFPRAPLDAGKALLAVMPPDRLAFLEIDIRARADGFADAAGIAFFIDPKTLVHFRDMRKGKLV